jgi:quercetin dioxygenase-like cupin family protein
MNDIQDLKEAHFEFALRRDGFTVERKTLEPNASTSAHAHPFDVRALVLNGEITLAVEGIDYAYRAGDIFVMPAGHLHAETAGPDGVEYLVGRRRPMHEAVTAQPEAAGASRVAGIEVMAARAIETIDERARA